MGCYHIHIQGLGCHHNGGAEYDADKIFADFVAELKRKGHTVTAASITVGSTEDVLQVNDRLVRQQAEAEAKKVG